MLMTHSNVWRDSIIFMTWQFVTHPCAWRDSRWMFVTQSYVWRDSSWLIHMCDVLVRDWFIFVTCLTLDVWDQFLYLTWQFMTHVHVWRGNSWLFHMCDVIVHDSFICVTCLTLDVCDSFMLWRGSSWLIHMCDVIVRDSLTCATWQFVTDSYVWRVSPWRSGCAIYPRRSLLILSCQHHLWMYTRSTSLFTHVYTLLDIYTHARMYWHTNMRILTVLFWDVHTFQISVYALIYMDIYICMYICIYIYI